MWNCHNNLRALQVIDIMRRGLFKAPLPEEANLLSKILRGLGGGWRVFWTSLAFIVVANRHYRIISQSLQICNYMHLVIELVIEGALDGLKGFQKSLLFWCRTFDSYQSPAQECLQDFY